MEVNLQKFLMISLNKFSRLSISMLLFMVILLDNVEYGKAVPDPNCAPGSSVIVNDVNSNLLGDNCTSCNAGYYINNYANPDNGAGTPVALNNCQPCIGLPNCISCTGPSICTGCNTANNYYLVSKYLLLY
jgi:hypothetical protein